MMSVLSTPQSDGRSDRHASWREAVDQEIAALGWRQGTRIDQPEDDVTIYVIDTVAPQDITFRPEGPATFSLSIFLDGRGTVSIDGARPLSIEPGMSALFVSNRYISGENTVSAGQHFHVVDLRFEPRFLMKAGGVALARLGGDLLTEHSLPDEDVTLIGMPSPPRLLQAARDIAACDLPDGLARRLYLYSKAIESLSIVVSTLRDMTVKRVTLRGDDRRRIDLAREIVETRYDADWTISRLAREVGLNERKLKEGFRLIVGNSVHAHLRQVRLDAAATLLREGRSVTETAFAVGFDNLSHFSKVFRVATGMSPRRYARRW